MSPGVWKYRWVGGWAYQLYFAIVQWYVALCWAELGGIEVRGQVCGDSRCVVVHVGGRVVQRYFAIVQWN